MPSSKPYKPLEPKDMIPGRHYAFCLALNKDKTRVTASSRGEFVGPAPRDPEFVLVIPRALDGGPQEWRSYPERPVHKHWTRAISTWEEWEEAGLVVKEI